MNKPVVAALVVAILGVAGFGVWANREDPEPHFCKAGAFIFGEVEGLEGYSVTLQDGGDPGPDGCDGDDRPGVESVAVDEVPAPAPDAAPTTTMVPQPPAEPDPEPVTEPLVLGFDCAFRDGDGTVVARAVPNRPGGECGLPGPDGRMPGELAR